MFLVLLVCLFVCLSVGLLKRNERICMIHFTRGVLGQSMDLHDFFTRGVSDRA